MREVFLRSDNAGCYHCAPLLLAIPTISQRTGVRVARYDFSEAQRGKDICDRKIAVMKGHVRRYINEGHNVTTAIELEEALESYGGLRGCSVSVVEINVVKQSKDRPSWPGIQSLTNFEYSEDGIRVWKAYSVGPGELKQKLPKFKQAATEILVHSRFPSQMDVMPPAPKKRKVGGERSLHEKEPHAEESPTQQEYLCPTPNCVKTFQTLNHLNKHLDAGRHQLKLHEDTPPDAIKKKWASVCTSLTSKPILKETDSSGTPLHESCV